MNFTNLEDFYRYAIGDNYNDYIRNYVKNYTESSSVEIYYDENIDIDNEYENINIPDETIRLNNITNLKNIHLTIEDEYLNMLDNIQNEFGIDNDKYNEEANKLYNRYLKFFHKFCNLLIINRINEFIYEWKLNNYEEFAGSFGFNSFIVDNIDYDILLMEDIFKNNNLNISRNINNQNYSNNKNNLNNSNFNNKVNTDNVDKIFKELDNDKKKHKEQIDFKTGRRLNQKIKNNEVENNLTNKTELIFSENYFVNQAIDDTELNSIDVEVAIDKESPVLKRLKKYEQVEAIKKVTTSNFFIVNSTKASQNEVLNQALKNHFVNKSHQSIGKYKTVTNKNKQYLQKIRKILNPSIEIFDSLSLQNNNDKNNINNKENNEIKIANIETMPNLKNMNTLTSISQDISTLKNKKVENFLNTTTLNQQILNSKNIDLNNDKKQNISFYHYEDNYLKNELNNGFDDIDNIFNKILNDIQQNKELEILQIKKRLNYNAYNIKWNEIDWNIKNKQNILKILDWANKEMVMTAINYNSLLYQYANIELQHDIEVASLAVKNNGNILALMPHQIQNNYEICKLALINKGNAIKYIGNDLKNNLILNLIAVINQPNIINELKGFNNNACVIYSALKRANLQNDKITYNNIQLYSDNSLQYIQTNKLQQIANNELQTLFINLNKNIINNDKKENTSFYLCDNKLNNSINNNKLNNINNNSNNLINNDRKDNSISYHYNNVENLINNNINNSIDNNKLNNINNNSNNLISNDKKENFTSHHYNNVGNSINNNKKGVINIAQFLKQANQNSNIQSYFDKDGILRFKSVDKPISNNNFLNNFKFGK